MISNTVLRNLTSVFLTACCAIGIATAHSQTYIVTDLGVLPDESTSISAALNEQGQVTGTSGESAFRADPGATMVDLGAPGLARSQGFAINGSSHVVGDSTFGESQVTHAALFANGSAIDLAASENPELFSRANGINAYGKVVGVFRSNSVGAFGRAFITDPLHSDRRQALIDLGTLGGPYAQALAINDSGFVTGNSEIDAHSRTTVGITHAFLWSDQTSMLDLGTLGGSYSYGTSINANNHVVGYATTDSSESRIHAFIHDGVMMRDLGSLDVTSEQSDRSFALSVNSADQVVGYSYVQSAGGVDPLDARPLQQVAFIYTQGAMRDLNTMIGDATRSYLIYSATGINNLGQITAVAFDQSSKAFHAVLLTPSQEIRKAKPVKMQPRQLSAK